MPHLLTVGTFALGVEPVLELLLNGDDLIIKGIVTLHVHTGHHRALVSIELRAELSSVCDSVVVGCHHRRVPLHLELNGVLDKARLVVQVDSMLILKVIHVAIQKRLVVAEFLPDLEHLNVVDSVFGAHRFKREEQLLTDGENLAGKGRPF